MRQYLILLPQQVLVSSAAMLQLTAQEADREWTGREIPEPHLQSHMDDPSLIILAAKTSSAKSKQEYVTCYDPSTAVRRPSLTGLH